MEIGVSTNSAQMLGLPSAMARGRGDADVIAAVEQVTGGDTLIGVGNVTIMRSGDFGRICERATVRLTADEREELIQRLMEHRFADLTTGLGER